MYNQNKALNVMIVGSFTTGYVGEVADETHLARELAENNINVVRMPRDIYKAYVDGETNPEWMIHTQAFDGFYDFVIFCKWHHFNNKKYVEFAKKFSTQTIYWTWDYMEWDKGSLDWHKEMAKAVDYHFTNEGGHFSYMKEVGVNPYYFPMDVVDNQYNNYKNIEEIYDVTFTGNYLDQGVRSEFIQRLSKVCKLSVFSYNPSDWQKVGVSANEAVYGSNYNMVVAQSKVCVHIGSSDDIWGYWSNRIGKTLFAGGALIARYSPGMELAIGEAADYFRTFDELWRKVDFYLENDYERKELKDRARDLGKRHFTSKVRMLQLAIILRRLHENSSLFK